MGEQLHVGLLSIDKRKLLSPEEEPTLFTGSYSEGLRLSAESQAKGLLAQHQIITSSEHGLINYNHINGAVARGYLVRESRRIDTEEHGLTLFTLHELHDFLQTEPQDIRGHFLRQILKYMN